MFRQIHKKILENFTQRYAFLKQHDNEMYIRRPKVVRGMVVTFCLPVNHPSAYCFVPVCFY